MAAEAKQAKKTKKAVKTLHQLQAEQTRGARKLAKLRDKLEMRTRKFEKLETKIAALERRVAGPAADASSKKLRPARLVINPTSGGFQKLAETPENLVATLRAHGIEAEVHIKTSGKELRAWVRQGVKEGVPLIIASGGDGTIGNVMGELVGSQTVLGIIPSGTMNNVARELGIPLDLEQACALVGAGNTRQIDVGRIAPGDAADGAYFIESAGVGMAVALPAGQNVKKGRWGKLPTAFRELFGVGTNPIIVELDNGERIETKVQLVTVSNAPLYALNNLIAPDAKMDDGLLDVAVYDGMSDIELATYFIQTGNGTRVVNPNVRFFRARQVKITGWRALPITADNAEITSRQVLDLEVLPGALTAIVGKGAALTWPVEAVASVPPLSGVQQQPKTDPVTSTNGHDRSATPESDAANLTAELALAGVGRLTP